MTTYNDKHDAANHGYDVAPGRTGKIMVNGKEYRVKDTSGGNSFGYNYSAIDENGNVVAESHTVWVKSNKTRFGEAFMNRFRSDEFPK